MVISRIRNIKGKIIKTWNKKHSKCITQIDAYIARSALRDAYVAHKNLKAALKENSNHQQIRMTWIACLFHLRAVGHVLKKVDSARSKWIKLASDKAYDNCRSNRFENIIFWEFIELERNALMKEYSAKIFDQSIDPENSKQKITVVTNILIGTEVYTPLEAVNRAIEWWENYLDKVESDAAIFRANKV